MTSPDHSPRRARARLVVALALAGCGGAKPAPAPPEPEPMSDDPAMLAQAMVDALGEMTLAAETHAGDCPSMAAALTEVFDRVRPTFAHIQELRADPEVARDLTTAFRSYDADADALAHRMTAALAGCNADAQVMDAMAKMPVIQ